MADWFKVLFGGSSAKDMVDQATATPVESAGDDELLKSRGSMERTRPIKGYDWNPNQPTLEMPPMVSEYHRAPLRGAPGALPTPSQARANVRAMPGWMPEKHIRSMMEDRDMGRSTRLRYRPEPGSPFLTARVTPDQIIYQKRPPEPGLSPLDSALLKYRR